MEALETETSGLILVQPEKQVSRVARSRANSHTLRAMRIIPLIPGNHGAHMLGFLGPATGFKPVAKGQDKGRLDVRPCFVILRQKLVSSYTLLRGIVLRVFKFSFPSKAKSRNIGIQHIGIQEIRIDLKPLSISTEHELQAAGIGARQIHRKPGLLGDCLCQGIKQVACIASRLD